MALSIRRTGSADYGRYIKALVCGHSGSGKTPFACTFPNPVIASAESGLMSVWEQDVPYQQIETVSTLYELLHMLDQPPNVRQKMFGFPVDTVVVDTIDEIGRLLQRERLAELKKDAMAMADWGWLGEQMRVVVRGFRNLDMHVVFTCHIRTATDEETGKSLVEPAIQGSMGNDIPQYVDLALLLQARAVPVVRDGETHREVVRYAQTYPDAQHRWVKDRSGKLPMEFPINFEDDFKRLNALIYGGMPDGPTEQEEAPPAVTPAASKARSAPAPAKAPEPQPEPEPVAAPEPPAPVQAEEREEVPEQEEETVPQTGMPACDQCGGAIESEDQKDLSMIRFRRPLCRVCFVEQKNQAKTK